MSEATAAAAPELLVRREGTLGHITLNRPKALNALTRDMAAELDAALVAWADDAEIVSVLIDGAGERGFCAGGDIRAIYNSAKIDGADARDFFRTEFVMNARIANYPKPIVAIMQGIVMGGGVGIAGHASHRIVTEDATIAMPEVDIGYLPDVGATYLLSRGPDAFGFHLALTAGRVDAADAILVNLADLHVPKASVPALATALTSCQGKADVEAALAAVSAPLPAGKLAAAKPWIDACYREAEVEQVVALLTARPEAEARAAAEAISTKSPTSLKVTLRALRQATHLSNIEECLTMEYRVACACLLGHDFVEGVRAAVIDKDRQPKWNPASLAGVTPEIVDRHFAVPAEGDVKL